jgi:hypothetical protein
MVSFVSQFVLAVALTAQVAAPPADAAAGQTVSYHFENEQFVLSRIDLTLDETGGKLVFVRKGVSAPVERTVRISAAAKAQVDELLGRLNFLTASEAYQTKDDHKNLGTVRIAVRSGSANREVSFNYTANRDMRALADLLRGIANREIYTFDIETAARHQPLDTPGLIKALQDEWTRGYVADASELLPLLQSLADDVTLPLITRNRAGDLAKQITKTGGK